MADASQFETCLDDFKSEYKANTHRCLRSDKLAGIYLEKFKKKLPYEAAFVAYYQEGLFDCTTDGHKIKLTPTFRHLDKVRTSGEMVLKTFLDGNRGLKEEAEEWLKKLGTFRWADFVNSAGYALALRAAYRLSNSRLKDNFIVDGCVIPVGKRQNVLAVLAALNDDYVSAYFGAAASHFWDMDISGNLASLLAPMSRTALGAYDADRFDELDASQLGKKMNGFVTSLNEGRQKMKDAQEMAAGPARDASQELEECLRIASEVKGILQNLEKDLDLYGFLQEKGIDEVNDRYLLCGMFFFEGGRRDVHIKNSMEWHDLYQLLDRLRGQGRNVLFTYVDKRSDLGELVQPLPEGIDIHDLFLINRIVAPLDAANNMRYNPEHYENFHLDSYGRVFAVNIDAKDKANTYLLNSVTPENVSSFEGGSALSSAIESLTDVYVKLRIYYQDAKWFKNAMLVEGRLEDLLKKMRPIIGLPEELPEQEAPSQHLGNGVDPKQFERIMSEMQKQVDNMKKAKKECVAFETFCGIREEADEHERHQVISALSKHQKTLWIFVCENARLMANTVRFCLDGKGPEHHELVNSIKNAALTKEFHSAAVNLSMLFIRVSRAFNHIAQGDVEWQPSLQYRVFLSHSGVQKPYMKMIKTNLEDGHKQPVLKAFVDKLDLIHGMRNEKLMQYSAMKCQVGLSYLTTDYLKSTWPMIELLLFLGRLQHSHQLASASRSDGFDEIYELPDRNFIFFPHLDEWNHERSDSMMWAKRGWGENSKFLNVVNKLPLPLERLPVMHVHEEAFIDDTVVRICDDIRKCVAARNGMCVAKRNT